MNKRAVKFSIWLGAAAGLALAGTAFAQGHRDRVVEREAQKAEQQQAPAQQEQPQAQQQRQQQQRRAAPAQSSSPSQRDRVVQREAERRTDRRSSSGGYYNNGRPPVVVGSPGYNRGGTRYRNPNYGRVVTVLPPGHRSYRWQNSPYYYYGGAWYRPRGASYVVVGAPFGLFVNYLPSYYSTMWVGGSRYYYADDTYYSYDASRRGYVVTQSPYGDDGDDEDYDDESSDSVDAELYIYPTKGQSEKQQADDKYECHRWSFDQTGYDPTQMEYERGKRVQYDRALSACLTARGYSVK